MEGASQGRGRGRQVVSTAKTADLILMMLDATKSEEQRRLLEIELDAVGIRLNKKKPDVVFKRKTTGGVSMSGHVVTQFLTHNLCRLPYVPSLASNTALTDRPVDFYRETYQDRRKDNSDYLGELYITSRCY